MKMERQRWPEIPLILGRSGIYYVAIVTKLSSSNCGAHLVESYCKESNISDTNWLRYLFTYLCTHALFSLGSFIYFAVNFAIFLSSLFAVIHSTRKFNIQ